LRNTYTLPAMTYDDALVPGKRSPQINTRFTEGWF